MHEHSESASNTSSTSPSGNASRLTAGAKSLLLGTAANAGDTLDATRAAMQERLHDAQGALSKARDDLVGHANEALGATRRYVQANPWKLVGVGMAIAAALAWMGRKR